ncbi:hypothetical protein AB6A40_005177 [Gnathostoma spinigerum]|uniref:Cyclin-dependent kinase inhibitor domain-containing protein n=1 Tax=Gnathostoma spinigerum TaxID=75299 RepID=A0ABD6EEU5_9BILA
MNTSLQVLPSVSSISHVYPTKKSARRCLFGRSDPKKNDLWLNEKLKAMRDEYEAKWSFDFVNDVPIISSSPQYSYNLVDAATVPSFYRMTYCPPDRFANIENEGISPVSSDSDYSMDDSIQKTPERCATVPTKQTKITSYMHVRCHKRLQRHAKVDDLSSNKNRTRGVVSLADRFRTRLH